MDINRGSSERRKDKRFKLKDPVFAILYSSQTKTAQIVDISRGGLAIRYVKNDYDSDMINKLDIFKSDFSFYMDNIKAKTISDIEVTGENFNGSKEVRRCGVQFENLSENQISQLERFIQNVSFGRGLNSDIK